MTGHGDVQRPSADMASDREASDQDFGSRRARKTKSGRALGAIYKKGGCRPIEAVEKGKATAKKRRRQHSAKRSSARRLTQREEHGARCFPRESPPRQSCSWPWNPAGLRSQIRALVPELPSGTLDAMLGQELVDGHGLARTRPQPFLGRKAGHSQVKGADSRPERLKPMAVSSIRRR